MGLLLDTHIFLWAAALPQRLAKATRSAIEDPATEVFVSVATCWEMAIKQARGRLDFPLSRLDETIQSLGFSVLPITLAHALAAGALPRHHADPFDRMLVAQAQLEGMTLATDDAHVRRYKVPILGGRRPR